MRSLYNVDDVEYMWKELENIGFTPLRTTDEVDNAIKNNNGTTLVLINSVCGCAAGHARPGAGLALQNKVIPDNLVTVFAGVDRDATARIREYLPEFQPSSPSMALFKNGKPVFTLHRSSIETTNAEGVAEILVEALGEHCDAKGPSVPYEVFEDNFAAPQCSSTLGKNGNG